MFYNWIIDLSVISGFKPKRTDNYTYSIFLRCKSTSLKIFDRYFGHDRE